MKLEYIRYLRRNKISFGTTLISLISILDKYGTEYSNRDTSINFKHVILSFVNKMLLEVVANSKNICCKRLILLNISCLLQGSSRSTSSPYLQIKWQLMYYPGVLHSKNTELPCIHQWPKEQHQKLNIIHKTFNLLHFSLDSATLEFPWLPDVELSMLSLIYSETGQHCGNIK